MGGGWGGWPPGASTKPGVLEGGVQGGPGQVEAGALGLGLEPGQQAQRLGVALETADRGGQFVEGGLAVVPERAVADVVRQASRVHQVRVTADLLADLARDLRD